MARRCETKRAVRGSSNNNNNNGTKSGNNNDGFWACRKSIVRAVDYR